MRAHSFATLITVGDDCPVATHIPFLIDVDGSNVILRAHVARANPQWRDFDSGAPALVIFAGPHAYISPSLYERPLSVPTWNYVAVHAYGRPRVIDDPAGVIALLDDLIVANDPEYLAEWNAMAENVRSTKLGHIVAFEIEVTQIEARYKLSQDRSETERSNILNALKASDDCAATELAAMTERLFSNY